MNSLIECNQPQRSNLTEIENTKQSINPALLYIMSLQSKMSRQKMGYILNHAARLMHSPDIFTHNWGALSRLQVMGIVEILKTKSYQPDTINTYLSALRGVAKEVRRLRQMDADDHQDIKDIANIRGHRLPKGRVLPSPEIEQLLQHCEQNNSLIGVRDSAIISILFGCGLRRSELVALDIGSVCQQSESLVVLGKGNKERRAFLPNYALERIRVWIEEVRGEWAGPLFTRIRKGDDITDDRLSDGYIYKMLKKKQLAASINHFTPHDCRRTYATQLLEHGVDIVTIKDMMGHADISTTQKYIRIKDEKMKAATKKLMRKKCN